MPDVWISGLEEVKADLLDLPRVIVSEMFPDALEAGGAVLEGEMYSRTPRAEYATTTAKEYGTLIDDLGTTTDVDEQRLEGNAKVGFSDDGFPARFIEFGSRRVAHDGRDTGKFSPANPFMRQSADAAEGAAIDAFEEALGDRIK